MRYLLLTLFVVFSMVLAGCNQESEISESAEMAEETEEAGYSYAVLDADPLVINELGERVLLVNYWAVWCKPCIEEMPELALFREEHADIAEVVGFNYDKPSEEQLRDDVTRLEVDIPVLLEDPRADFGYPLVDALPVTWAIYKGEVVGSLLGPQTGETLLEAVESVIAETP